MSGGLKPTPKVTAGAAAGAASTVAIWVASQFSVSLPETVAAALVVLVSFGAAWLRREAPSED